MASSFKHTCVPIPSSTFWNSLHEIYSAVQCLVSAISTRIYITKLLKQGPLHRWENPSRRICSFTPESKIPGRGKKNRAEQTQHLRGRVVLQFMADSPIPWALLDCESKTAEQSGYTHYMERIWPSLQVRGSRISWTLDLSPQLRATAFISILLRPKYMETLTRAIASLPPPTLEMSITNSPSFQLILPLCILGRHHQSCRVRGASPSV
jgi:hypothetical protein